MAVALARMSFPAESLGDTLTLVVGAGGVTGSAGAVGNPGIASTVTDDDTSKVILAAYGGGRGGGSSLYGGGAGASGGSSRHPQNGGVGGVVKTVTLFSSGITIPDLSANCVLAYVQNLEEWVIGAVLGMVNRGKKKMIKQYHPIIMADPSVTTMPATEDGLIEMILARDDYQRLA